MPKAGFPITGSMIFAAGVLGLAAFGGDTSLPAQNIPSASPAFQPGAATHETRADPQASLQFPITSEIAAGIETVSSAPPTRSSFMATWDSVTGATGYLLDVSTSDSFSDYLDGYHAWTWATLQDGS